MRRNKYFGVSRKEHQSDKNSGLLITLLQLAKKRHSTLVHGSSLGQEEAEVHKGTHNVLNQQQMSQHCYKYLLTMNYMRIVSVLFGVSTSLPLQLL